ncbi:MAG: hypothetical protein KatS3mg076_3061 [Candidatus Binatia bacterium]|nr:MAG: hypothetical protein KatS3mg076_3061 [Candidatus Binatia bacterium]
MPGLLALRELPAIVLAWEKLRIRPDLLLCDAQGTAHPNRFGLACRLGVVLGVATVGCGKSPLVGEHDPVPAHRGARAWLWHEGERVGLVVRTRASVRPLYVSPGHGIGFDESYRVVLDASPHTRLPEPLRAAHHLATLARNAEV